MSNVALELYNYGYIKQLLSSTVFLDFELFSKRIFLFWLVIPVYTTFQLVVVKMITSAVGRVYKIYVDSEKKNHKRAKSTFQLKTSEKLKYDIYIHVIYIIYTMWLKSTRSACSSSSNRF